MVSDIVYRNKKGDGYIFTDASGKEVKDKKTLTFATSFYIAPAYVNVEIHTNPNDKILYTGIDVGGKKQYFYKDFWHKQRDRKKFCHMIQFGKAFPKIKADINKLLQKKRWNINKMIALQLKIMMLCNFRIGNILNGKKNKSTGISTLKSKHLYFRKNDTLIKFIGKSTVENRCLLKDKEVIKLIKDLSNKRSSGYLFMDSKGNKRVDAVTVNKFLKRYGDFTSKDFRTWIANTSFIAGVTANNIPDTITARKSAAKESIKNTAEQLHHTPSICKKKYIYPGLLNMYIDNPTKFKKLVGANYNNSPESAFIAFMQKACT